MKTEPAFPFTDADGTVWPGMTLRDYFAAKAMQAILSNPNWMKDYNGEKYLMQNSIVSDVSYSCADAMLTEREKPEQL